MRFRLLAFGLHLTGSAAALTLVLGALWLGWYRWPGWYLASAVHVVGIMVMVDLVLGPTLTAIVANSAKRRAVLARDISVIIAVQLVALVYGSVTLWGGRPLYYTFSADRLELVQASDLKPDDVRSGRHENPALAPLWYSLPRWIWAPLPENPQEAERIALGAVLGGSDIIQMPRYFRPWKQGLPDLRKRLAKVDDMRSFSAREKRALQARMAHIGLPADQPNSMVMWGGTRRVLVVFEMPSMEVRAILAPD